jgi:hypothetical protein
MMSEEQALTLIRQYVTDSRDEKRREDPTAVTQLLKEPDVALTTLKEHFGSFTGHDRFWLYALAGYLLPDPQARSQFYADRLPLEDDPICRQLVLRTQKLKR